LSQCRRGAASHFFARQIVEMIAQFGDVAAHVSRCDAGAQKALAQLVK
jgi:hypothetical protein